MNRRITLPAIVAGVAEATGLDTAFTDSFMRALVDTIATALFEDGETSVAGLGTFRVVDSVVMFYPVASMAEAVNEPFACFEPVELAAGFDENDIEPIPSQAPETPAESHEETDDTPEEKPVTEEETPEVEEQAPEVKEETPEVEQPAPSAVPTLITTPTEEEEAPHAISYEDEQEYHSRRRPCEPGSFNGYGKLVLGLAIGLIVGYLTGRYSTDRPVNYDYEYTDSQADGIPAPADSIVTPLPADTVVTAAVTPAAQADTAAAAEQPREVTDTIARNRYLTGIARRHYGDYRFWVYIYEENRDVIKDPDRVAPGTVVKIPPASKYGIDAADPASLRAAELKSREIRATL